jgi:hypothetical protein
MLHVLHRQLLRHRRHVIALCVVLGLAGVAIGAHAGLPAVQHHGGVHDAVGTCLVIGGCAAIAGMAVLKTAPGVAHPPVIVAAPTPTERPTSPPVGGVFLVRAGPPPGIAVLRL